ncbi:MAG: insulinase family protein [Spirochaetales bacterium]|nr:insulinase family protein [Spirochaetales bacterium]
MKKLLLILTITISIVTISCQDRDFLHGELENGLTYYIRKTNNPTDKAILRLAVKAGSADETEEQRGLAHLLEHMAFNGSANFPEDSLIEFLQSLGIQYGPELNAHTSFNETIYKLEIPLEEPNNLETGFLVLEDWAFNLNLADESIEKERLVVIEEYRSRRDARYRIVSEYWPKLFNNTKYAERMPIGTLENLQKFTPQMVRDFYTQHYTPERIAIIVVGEIEPLNIEKKIISQFSKYKSNSEIEPYIGNQPSVADQKFIIIQEKELQYTLIQLTANNPLRADTIEHRLQEAIFTTALNSRFETIKERGTTEILDVGAWNSQIIAPTKTFSLSYICRDDKITKSIGEVFTELKRLHQHGFDASEIEAATNQVVEGLKMEYESQADLDANYWIQNYQEAFIYSQNIFSSKRDYKKALRIAAKQDVSTINNLIEFFLPYQNILTIISTPARPPQRDEISEQAEKAYADETRQENFGSYIKELENRPASKGKIISISEDKDLEIKKFTLSNGAEVILKRNKSKKDEVLFSHISRGGYSTVNGKELINAKALEPIISNCGLSQYSATQISTWKQTNNIELNFSINEQFETFTGRFSPQKAEDFFKLLNLQLTQPTITTENFNRIIKSLKEDAKNRKNNPDEVFTDEIIKYLSQNNKRFLELDSEEVESIELEQVLEIFNRKTTQQGDDTYIFVGNISEKKLKPLLERYIASIGNSTESQYINNRKTYPTSSKSQTIAKGQEKITNIRIYNTGKIEPSAKNIEAISMLSYVMDTTLNNKIREELGGTYSISTYGTMRIYPYEEFIFITGFSCDPERSKELLKAVYIEKEKASSGSIAQEHIDNYKKTISVSLATEVTTNNFWVRSLSQLIKGETTTERILNKEKIVNEIDKEYLTRLAETIFSSTRGEFTQIQE